MKRRCVRKETEADVISYKGRKVGKKDISDRMSCNELMHLIIEEKAHYHIFQNPSHSLFMHYKFLIN